MRARTWLVEGEDGNCSVIRNGRELAVGLTEQAAVALARRQVRRGDKAYRVESDGYRIPIPV
jgi:hypothetical protein